MRPAQGRHGRAHRSLRSEHDYLAARGLSLSDPLAPHVLGAELARQSAMLSYVDAFRMITLSFAALAPLVLLLRRPQTGQGAPAGMH